jgi:hypothetical protein
VGSVCSAERLAAVQRDDADTMLVPPMSTPRSSAPSGGEARVERRRLADHGVLPAVVRLLGAAREPRRARVRPLFATSWRSVRWRRDEGLGTDRS